MESNRRMVLQHIKITGAYEQQSHEGVFNSIDCLILFIKPNSYLKL